MIRSGMYYECKCKAARFNNFKTRVFFKIIKGITKDAVGNLKKFSRKSSAF